MVSDPPNRHYGAILPALLQTQPLPIASATFQGLYGGAFAAPTEQNKDPGRSQSRTSRAAAHDDVPQNQPRWAK